MVENDEVTALLLYSASKSMVAHDPDTASAGLDRAFSLTLDPLLHGNISAALNRSYVLSRKDIDTDYSFKASLGYHEAPPSHQHRLTLEARGHLLFHRQSSLS